MATLDTDSVTDPVDVTDAGLIRTAEPGGIGDLGDLRMLTPRVIGPIQPVSFPTVTLPSIQIVSPQPGQVFSTDGLVRISVITSAAARLDFFAKQAGGSGLVFLRSFGPVSQGSQTQIDVPASQIPFQSAVIQVNLFQNLFSAPFSAFSGQFFIQSQLAESNAQFTSPQGGEIWSCFQVQTVTWTFNGSPQRWEIAYSLNNGPFVTVNNQIPGADRIYYFFPPFVPAPTQARLRLRKVSSSGVIKDTISNPFTLVNF